MSKKNILLIVNPGARAGNSDLSEAVEFLRRSGLSVRREFIEAPRQITELIERFGSEVDGVVLGGGDGTFNRAAEALLKCGKPLGILPMGTANDLARTLGIPADLLSAAGIIVQGHTRRIDLGCVNDDVWFFNVAHIGLGTLVTRRLSEEKKRQWGKVSYLRTLLEAWRGARPFRVELNCDGHREDFHSIEIAVGNGRSYGGGMTIASEARIDDQMLHLFSLDPQSVFRLAALFPALFTGNYEEKTKVRFRSGREITVRTVKPLKVVADGEERTLTPARFTIRHKALSVFVPADSKKQEGKDAANRS
jgi:YegS/Rv2252/BmrU family lipid kinase